MAPVIQSVLANSTASTIPPAAKDAAARRHKRIQPSAAGEKIATIARSTFPNMQTTGFSTGSQQTASNQTELEGSDAVNSASGSLRRARSIMARSVIPSGYERSDVTAKTIAFIAIGIALFLFVVPFIIQMVFRSDQPAIDLAEMKKPPEPLLQIDPAGEIETFNQAEQKQLGSFGPTGKGAFHIPIDQAKDRIVQRGLPGWSPDTAPVKSP